MLEADDEDEPGAVPPASGRTALTGASRWELVGAIAGRLYVVEKKCCESCVSLRRWSRMGGMLRGRATHCVEIVELEPSLSVRMRSRRRRNE